MQNNTLETLDLQNNRIGKVRDMKVSKGFDMSETLRQIRSCFKYLKEIKKVESLLINDWLFDDLEYPDNVADCIKETRVQIQDKTAFATISSTKRGT